MRYYSSDILALQMTGPIRLLNDYFFGPGQDNGRRGIPFTLPAHIDTVSRD